MDLIRTMVAVPMLKGDDLVGAITAYKLEVKPFTDKQIAAPDLRRPSRHRYRERPAVQGASDEQPRSHPGPG